MSNIDRQRVVAAVRKLEGMGYTFPASDWMQPAANDAVARPITDALHSLLVARADDLATCREGSDEERELAAITDAIETYKAVRWPGRRMDRRKG